MLAHLFLLSAGIMIVNQFKVAILFYMLIAIREQSEFEPDHNHEHHHHKHPHGHDHDHHRRSEIRKASKIYNGVRTFAGQGKFMAVIVNYPGDVYCSAVIITETMLLTAAHCLSNSYLGGMRILPRALSLRAYRNNNPNNNHNPLIKSIRNFWIHPRFATSPNNTYDIAIVQIGPQPWHMGQGIDTALMPVNITNLDLRAIKGYGFGREVGNVDTGFLNEMNFKYLWTQSMYERIFPFQRLNDRYVYFGATNWNPDPSLNPHELSIFAPGDSGGGIFIHGTVKRLDRRRTNQIIQKHGWILVGIESRAVNYTRYQNAHRRLPYAVFAVNVTNMMPWISRVVGIDFQTYP